MENPIKMDDLGLPLFSETPIYPIRIPIEGGMSEHPQILGSGLSTLGTPKSDP